MTKEEVTSILTLAKIPILQMWEAANNYWPETHKEERLRDKWWLIKTPRGLIYMGWRKRVISIDWTDTGIRKIVTKDEVTKDGCYVHAYGVEKAIEYLKQLAPFMTKFPTPEDQEHVASLVRMMSVEWQYRNEDLVMGYSDPWTFIMPVNKSPLHAIAVHGPTFVNLDEQQTDDLRHNFESRNEIEAIPIFKP